MDFGKPVVRNNWASFSNLMGALVVIVPHFTQKSERSKQNSQGETYFPDETIASIIPVQDVAGTNSYNGKPFDYKAGTAYWTTISVKARTQLGDPGQPILARIGKGQARNGAGAPTVLIDPTDDDVALATAVLADFDPETLSAPPQRSTPVEYQPARENVTPERTQGFATGGYVGQAPSGPATPPWRQS
jgi:hypothetical protein